MNQGVIRNLKVNYRKQLVGKLSQCIETRTEYSVNVLDALHFLKSAWDNVSIETISNCFMRVVTETALPTQTTSLPTMPLDISSGMNPDMFEHYVSVDNDVVCTEDISDVDVLLPDTSITEHVDFSTDGIEHFRESRSTRVILENLEQLRFDASTFKNAENAFDRINWLMNWFETQRHQNRVQTTIKNFFEPRV